MCVRRYTIVSFPLDAIPPDTTTQTLLRCFTALVATATRTPKRQKDETATQEKKSRDVGVVGAPPREA